ncbi:putative deoxyribonuclease-2 [Ornithodoros turicata]|uniref:putative deoxyribonuclease-2 n=1 Tax=Ornithodoros turicata TaxID=34597 RepID=UPI003138914A
MNLLLEGNFFGQQQNQKFDGIYSRGGTYFLTFSKQSSLVTDIYSDNVSVLAHDSLLVQSWLVGAGGKIGPVCRGNSSVLDSSYINLHMSGKSWKWSNTEDHSKWAVGVNTPLFCLGSLNRMVSQKSRGGQVTCMNNPMVHRLFKSAHETSEHC